MSNQCGSRLLITTAAVCNITPAGNTAVDQAVSLAARHASCELSVSWLHTGPLRGYAAVRKFAQNTVRAETIANWRADRMFCGYRA
jgi:hypothetical protein